MTKFALAFILMILFKLTHQSQSVCTRFSSTSPRAVDLGKIAREVLKLQFPKLADYSDVPNSQTAINKDYSRLTEGINNPDARLTIAQLVQKYGFYFEQYNNVRTEDGYYLTLHRIPNLGNKVVFLNHGLFGSSIDYFMAGKDSLPFILASLGYDVWLGNFRGNKYSITHESWHSDCAQFWDFSYDDLGYYDLPASIDFIRYMTGQSKLTFVGHSMSATAFLVMASLRPKYNEVIDSMIAMSPMAWSTHIKSPLIKLLAANVDMDRILKSGLGQYEFRPTDSMTKTLRSIICADNSVSEVICSQMPFLITGFNRHLLNMDNFYTISQHYPAGSSIKTLIHYSQNAVSGQFRRYDYPDANRNIDKYDSMIPTDYPVENIKAKVSFILSYNDCLSNVTDVLKLSRQLPHVGDMVYVDDYSNVDYLWAINVKEKVYNTIVRLIQK